MDVVSLTADCRQGSTEAECYNELKCSDHCCTSEELRLKDCSLVGRMFENDHYIIGPHLYCLCHYVPK